MESIVVLTFGATGEEVFAKHSRSDQLKKVTNAELRQMLGKANWKKVLSINIEDNVCIQKYVLLETGYRDEHRWVDRNNPISGRVDPSGLDTG